MERCFRCYGIDFTLRASPEDWNRHNLERAFDWIMASLQHGPHDRAQAWIGGSMAQQKHVGDIL